MNLKTYKEIISDMFHSTFTAVDKNTLMNMLTPRDFEPLKEIIANVLPQAEIEFEKTNQLKGEYDIYSIKDVSK